MSSITMSESSKGVSAHAGESVSAASAGETSKSAQRSASGGDGDGDEDEEDEGDAMDFKTLQSFNQKIQRFPTASLDLKLDLANPFNPPAAQKIIIPKRGEKDFEPLNETVNLQEMMLQQSREALFEALTGVRGGSSNNMSHALLTPSHPFPHMLISRGNVSSAMGHTVRSKAKAAARMELLPEEALYMIERGSLQLWYGTDEDGNGEWSDEIYGVVGATEMSVMQAYATFIGKEGLTLERYQAYAYLKRLGYTVQRTRTFLPTRLRDSIVAATPSPRITLSHLAWFRPDRLLAVLYRNLARLFVRGGSVLSSLTQRGLGNTLLKPWQGSTYRSLFTHLRIIPCGHSQSINNPPTQSASTVIPSTQIYTSTDQYQILLSNPYIPFFHVWQPSVAWSRKDWLKGSEEGLAQLPPNFWLAVVNVRQTSLPSLEQISAVFEVLPHDPAPVWKPRNARLAPVAPVQSRFTESANQSLAARFQSSVQSWWQRLVQAGEAIPPPHPRSVDMHLKQGDRTLVVATADSGNIGWVRLGRGCFDDYPVV